MAVLSITEYKNLARDAAGHLMPMGDEPSTTQTVDFTAGATLSAQFDESTRFVRLYADTACNVVFGDNTVIATTGDMPLAAFAPEPFGVGSTTPGNPAKVEYLSVITT